MVCFIDVDGSQLLKTFHRGRSRIFIIGSREHRVEIQYNIYIDENLNENREHSTYLSFVVLTAPVEVKCDQMAEDVSGSNAFPVMLYARHI